MKKRVRIKKVFAMILSLVLITGICIPGYAAQGKENELEPQMDYIEQLAVPSVLQKDANAQIGNNWCWAACMASVTKYLKGVTYTPEQVVSLVLGSQVDIQLDIEDVQDSLRNYPFRINSTFAKAVYGDEGGFVSPPVTANLIISQIDQGRPMLAILDTVLSGGHFVVISGYRMNNTTGEVWIYYMDPADGLTYCETYSNFCFKSYGTDAMDQKERCFDAILYNLGVYA